MDDPLGLGDLILIGQKALEEKPKKKSKARLEAEAAAAEYSDFMGFGKDQAKNWGNYRQNKPGETDMPKSGHMPTDGHMPTHELSPESEQMPTDGHMPKSEHLLTDGHMSKSEHMPPDSKDEIIPEPGHMPTDGHMPKSEQMPPEIPPQLTPHNDGRVGHKRLCALDMILLKHLIERNPVTTTIKKLAIDLCVNFGTLRHSITRLESRLYIKTEPVMRGSLKSTTFILDGQKCMDFIQTINSRVNLEIGHMSMREHMSNFEYMSKNKHMSKNEHMSNHPPSEHMSTHGHMDTSSLDRKKEEDSIYLGEVEKLIRISESDFELFWPNLVESGFRASNLRSAIAKRREAGFDLGDEVAKALRLGLRNADVTWEMSGGQVKDAKGKVVENFPGWLFKTLVRDAFYPAPKNWEEPGLAALREEAKKEEEKRALEAKAAKAAEKRTLAEGFEVFWENPPKAEYEACKEKSVTKTEESIKQIARIRWTKGESIRE